MTQRLQAIVLAGGSGSRFGGGKLLAPYRGGSLIDGALRSAFAAPVESVIVVTGYSRDDVGEAVTTFVHRHHYHSRLILRHADNYAEGMAATLKAGVAALSDATEGAFVFLGDMPSIPADVPTRLASDIGERAAAAPVFGETQGHPILFARRLFPKLLDLKGDKGARSVLDALGSDLALIKVEDDGILFDVDRWSDLAR